MTHDPPPIVSQYFAARRALIAASDADGRERLDGTLRDIALTDPDAALTIMRELSISDDFTAREAVAIYVRYLFPMRPEHVKELLIALLGDANPDIARQALSTIDELTGDPELDADQAASRLQAMTDNDH